MKSSIVLRKRACSLLDHRDSLTCVDIYDSKVSYLMADDDTASTASSFDDSFTSTSPSVAFASPLVTEIRYRPTTTREEKALLFYTDSEYRSFRRDYFDERRSRKRVVRFSTELVSDTHEYESPEDTAALYYNETDLQRCVFRCMDRLPVLVVPNSNFLSSDFRFLDDFVCSLNKPLP